MAVPGSLILIAGDPGRRQRQLLILLTKVKVKTLIGPAQARYPFENESMKLGRENIVLWLAGSYSLILCQLTFKDEFHFYDIPGTLLVVIEGFYIED